MAQFTFREETDDITSNIVKKNKNGSSILRIVTKGDSQVTTGDTVKYQDKDGTLIFQGIVQEVKTDGEKEIVVEDFLTQLNRVTINKVYNNTSPEGIIQDVVNNFTDMTYTSSISTGETIGLYVSKDKRAIEIVNEIAGRLNADYRVDENKNFVLFLRGNNSSGKNIDSNNAVLAKPWKRNKDQLVNVVIVKGDKQEFDKIETFSGDGSTTEFVLSQIPIDVRVTVGGTEQEGYVAGQGSGDYVVEKENKKIIFDSAPPSGTDNITVEYIFEIPVKIERKNKSSIDTYGESHKVYEKKYIKSREDARKFANTIIERFKDPILSSEWTMKSMRDYRDFLDFVPGDSIVVDDTLRGVSDTFIIEKIKRDFPGQLTIKVGEIEDDIVFWQKEVTERVKQLEEKDDNSTVINFDEQITENVEIQLQSDVITFQKRTDPGNAFYFDANKQFDNGNFFDGMNDEEGIAASKIPLRVPFTADEG